jgi:hypothetical protein
MGRQLPYQGFFRIWTALRPQLGVSLRPFEEGKFPIETQFRLSLSLRVLRSVNRTRVIRGSPYVSREGGRIVTLSKRTPEPGLPPSSASSRRFARATWAPSRTWPWSPPRPGLAAVQALCRSPTREATRLRRSPCPTLLRKVAHVVADERRVDLGTSQAAFP